ncbi:cupin domain-containing protein [Microvirga puerhi]|uniref:Cupin domain-containing protein n=1 Tax=Microvirga puerhi TaxID=2876078 RepID=A0ABS7VNQ8_9HYPH|nr:cupin domain-containing protein [Microvirga puerhi]MBZ6077150.1 cupin domain-containing protein [Microvirga puerhi]
MSHGERPSFIRNYSDIQNDDGVRFQGTDELRSIGSPFSPALGLTRLGIHHELLPPGRRTSLPHAESAEEEFVYVLEGTPDVWIDGDLFRLAPGDGVGFPAGTGIAHSFLNNTDKPVRLLVVGEATKPENRIVYPANPERRALRTDWWEDAPVRPLGPHDGKARAPK